MTSLYFDGSSKNPGKSGAGIYIKELDISKSKYLGPMLTNNEAEYMALIFGLEVAKSLSIKELNVYGDSKLVIMQSQGLWKINHEHLRKLNKQVKDLSSSFDKITFNHIPREENKIADKLSNNYEE